MMGFHHTSALAPGKVILSGEHAVVHGRPALVTAARPFARCDITETTDGLLTLHLPNLDSSTSWTRQALADRAGELFARYRRFEAGELEIGRVADQAGDLAVLAAWLTVSGSSHPGWPSLAVTVRSDIPGGAGMGSSAATTAALLVALHAHLGLASAGDDLYDTALQVETFQHGRPSGVDPYTVLHGGAVRFRNGKAEATLPALNLRAWLVDTGAPVSSTGECVMQVSRQFGASAVWDEFEAVAHSLETALREGQHRQVLDAIRTNHQLLSRIGVVPERVGMFIRAVEDAGGAAKVCGAGSVRGPNAGMVLVVADDRPDDVCRPHGYTARKLQTESKGARIATE